MSATVLCLLHVACTVYALVWNGRLCHWPLTESISTRQTGCTQYDLTLSLPRNMSVYCLGTFLTRTSRNLEDWQSEPSLCVHIGLRTREHEKSDFKPCHYLLAANVLVNALPSTPYLWIPKGREQVKWSPCIRWRKAIKLKYSVKPWSPRAETPFTIMFRVFLLNCDFEYVLVSQSVGFMCKERSSSDFVFSYDRNDFYLSLS